MSFKQIFVLLLTIIMAVSVSACANLITATLKGDIKTVQTLIDKGADVNVVDRKQWTPLMHSSSRGDIKMTKVLIEKGADVNINNKYNSAFTLAIKGYPEIAKLLLEKGQDVNVYLRTWTPLIYASYYGHTEIVKLLLEKEADVNAKDLDGKTALILAAQYNKTEYV